MLAAQMFNRSGVAMAYNDQISKFGNPNTTRKNHDLIRKL
jgi:hypothetical protein